LVIHYFVGNTLIFLEGDTLELLLKFDALFLKLTNGVNELLLFYFEGVGIGVELKIVSIADEALGD
jgi:hypothetical protein